MDRLSVGEFEEAEGGADGEAEDNSSPGMGDFLVEVIRQMSVLGIDVSDRDN